MLFRPEEIHGTSGIGQVVKPLPKRYAGVSHDAFRLGIQDGAIFHLDSDRFATIQTGGIYLNFLARKQPADRQRFEPSLPKPLLLTIDSDAVLGGKAAERWKRADVVGIGKQPGRKAG